MQRAGQPDRATPSPAGRRIGNRLRWPTGERDALQLAAGEEISSKRWKALVRAGRLQKIYTQKQIRGVVADQLMARVSDVLTVYGSGRSGNLAFLALMWDWCPSRRPWPDPERDCSGL